MFVRVCVENVIEYTHLTTFNVRRDNVHTRTF